MTRHPYVQAGVALGLTTAAPVETLLDEVSAQVNYERMRAAQIDSA